MKSVVPLLLAFASLTMLRAEEAPPKNMQEHFAWCQEIKSATASIARFEGFWKAYLPAEEGGLKEAGRGYGDGSHVIHVRLCAYRLLKLHLDTRDKEKAKYYAAWLEATDPMTGVKPSKIPIAPK